MYIDQAMQCERFVNLCKQNNLEYKEGLKSLSCSISGIVVMSELPACLVTNDLVPSYFALLITSIILLILI